jgi:hypothetical protein
MLHVYSCLSVFSINCLNKLSLTKIEGATKNGQSRETGNTGQPRTDNSEKPATPGAQDTRQRQTKSKTTNQCVGYRYAQTY